MGSPGKDVETLKNHSSALFKEKRVAQERLGHTREKDILCSKLLQNTDKLKEVIDRGTRRWSKREEHVPEFVVQKNPVVVKQHTLKKSLS